MRSRFEDLQASVLVSVRDDGLTLEDAAARAGVPANTVRGWARQGRKQPDGRFGSFAAALDASRDDARDATPMDWAEFEDHLATAVRSGSTTAMKLFAALHADERPGATTGSTGSDVLDDLDELAQARQKRGEVA